MAIPRPSPFLDKGICRLNLSKGHGRLLPGAKESFVASREGCSCIEVLICLKPEVERETEPDILTAVLDLPLAVTGQRLACRSVPDSQESKCLENWNSNSRRTKNSSFYTQEAFVAKIQ